MHSLTAKPLLKKHGIINLSKFAAVTSEVNVFRNNNVHVCMKSNTGVEDSEYNRASFLLHPIKKQHNYDKDGTNISKNYNTFPHVYENIYFNYH